MNQLLLVIQKLSLARDLNTIIEIVRHSARDLTQADGASFILRDQDCCHYVDEDAIGPLWKGRKFPLTACISGWSMMNRQSVAIENIFEDPRIPIDAYNPTFVRSLVMVPIRTKAPIGAIGIYWASHHKASSEEVQTLQSLADSTSIALENVQLYSSLKRSLDETQKAKDLLEHQLALRDEFISITAHELKTPLTPLLIQFQFINKLIKTHELSNHPKRDLIERLMRELGGGLHDFSKLIDNLLDVSRIRFDQFSFQLEQKSNLTEIVRKVVDEYSLSHGGEIQGDLQQNVEGKWDCLRLEQAIRNLVSNAVKYGEKKPIRISVSSDGQFATLTVTDQGIGIDEKDHERIFQRFERAVSLKNYGGMGLGLYISKKIIRAHGGNISVKSSPGEGACFRVELPLVSEALSVPLVDKH